MPDTLRGASVLIAGAGLAGLTAARDLRRRGAQVVVVEARDRVGGRVWTIRDDFVDGQHAEAGGDLIDAGQKEIVRLTRELGLRLTPILRQGFSFYDSERRRIVGGEAGWREIQDRLAPLVRAYNVSEQRWDGAIARTLAERSVADWLDEISAGPRLRAVATGLRGFFLADPADLSLLALVDQFASPETPASARMYRIKGGNDALATAIAQELGNGLRLRTSLRGLVQSQSRVEAHLDDPNGPVMQAADYVVLAVPATSLRALHFDPPLPARQREAIVRTKYGSTSKTLLQFDRRFWRRAGRSRAYGTALPIGAVWDGNEQQRGPKGILTLMAGGSASGQTQELLARKGPSGLVAELHWLGSGRARLLANRTVVWERDPWAGGGYALFDRGYDPLLRSWLARPFGRIVFAGEHTSLRWQGYMNGAVESGLRAAAEIAALVRSALAS